MGSFFFFFSNKIHRRIQGRDEEGEEGAKGIPNGQTNLSIMVRAGGIQYLSHVLNFRDILKERDKVYQFGIAIVVKPRNNGDRILRVPQERGRGVINDDGFLQITSKPSQILHIAALVLRASITEKAITNNTVLIKQIEDRVGILGQTRCENHNLKQLPAHLHKVINTRSLQNINLVNLVFYLYWDDKIGICDGLWKDLVRKRKTERREKREEERGEEREEREREREKREERREKREERREKREERREKREEGEERREKKRREKRRREEREKERREEEEKKKERKEGEERREGREKKEERRKKREEREREEREERKREEREERREKREEEKREEEKREEREERREKREERNRNIFFYQQDNNKDLKGKEP